MQTIIKVKIKTKYVDKYKDSTKQYNYMLWI